MIREFWQSTIGKKVVMAATGLIGVGFVISHVASNVAVFGSPQKVNDYAVFLRSFGPLLTVARGVLLAAVLLHVVAAVQLVQRARAARPVDYRKRRPQVSTLASRTMKVGGVLLLAFIIFHLADLTFGLGHPSFVHLRPAENMVAGLKRWPVAVFYILAMVSLGLHIYHGTWSSMRTMGAARQTASPLKRMVPLLLAVLIAGGFASIPLAVLFGVLR
jgi:succinate dehydrogenase / fumarate reductase, cytochrome b subunit